MATHSALPDEWTSTVVLGDGTSALIRPIEPTDAPALATFHERQPASSRYRRYFSPKPELTDEELERFTNVDFVDRVALVVEQHGEFIAWAGYDRWQNRPDVEVAFHVDEDQHGKGIATLLLEHLAVIARQNGFERFTASTMADNRAMLAVFAKAGWPVHRSFDSGMIDVDFDLDDTAEYLDSVERREHRADSRAVAHLLLPTSIAVIGASDRPGTVGEALWRNVSSNDRLRTYAVNPGRDRVDDTPAYDRVTDIVDDVNLAVIAVPAAALTSTIDDCITKRVRGAVVITAVDDAASIDLDALVERARSNGLRIIGPTSMGLASPRPDVSLQAALVEVALPAGSVAVSMQSGSLGSSFLRQAAELHLGLSWFVSLGDKLDISANDLLQFWEDDEATEVIALYTESLGNPRKFARIARRVSHSRPIVSVRTGAALLDPANATLYRETGVIEVPTVTDLLDTVRVFANQPLMAGRRVALVSNARSPAVLAEATLTSAGLTTSVPDQPLTWESDDDEYEAAVRAAMDDDDVDAVLVIHAPPTPAEVSGPCDGIERGAHRHGEHGTTAKPVVTVMLGAGDGPLQPGSAIPSFAFPEQAAAVLARVAAYSRWRSEEADDDDDTVLADLDRAAAEELIAEADADAGEVVLEPEIAHDLLASYGIPMAPTIHVAAGDAVAAANEVGYPVAIKARHRRIGRSIEAGMALDLNHDAEVAEAVAAMQEHLGDGADEVLVQPMLHAGTDVRLHVVDDERLGPIVTVGLGGVQADLIGDEVSRLAPVSPTVGTRMVESSRAAAALSGDDIRRLGGLIARVSHLAADHSRIDELDLNPVIVSSAECVVADATIRLGDPDRLAAVRRL